MDFNLVDLAKIVIPAMGAWVAAWLQNRKERRQWAARQEVEQRAIFGTETARLTGSWNEMTTQMREMITRLQVETIDAKTRAAVAEERAAGLAKELVEVRSRLERELADVKRNYEAALAELDRLKERRPKQSTRQQEKGD